MAVPRIGKKEVVRIDVDWLLGESPGPSVRDYSWFRRLCVSLICILIVVWSWPYTSKQWLRWEWQQRLAQSSGKPTEDVLPILLALSELSPNQNEELVRQLGSADPGIRSFAYHLLEQRLEGWSQTTRPSASEWIALANALGSAVIQLPESVQLRAQLATRMRALVPAGVPNSLQMLASLDVMIGKADAANAPPFPVESIPATSTNEKTAEALPSLNASSVGIKFSSNDTESLVESLDPPSIRQSQGPLRNSERVVIEVRPTPTSIQTLSDQASNKTVSQLPNLNLPIPRIVSKAMVIQTPPGAAFNASVQPTDEITQLNESGPSIALESTVTRGIEKLTIEKILLLLSSSQSRLVHQASNELLRRGMTHKQLDLAIELAQGDVEQRLNAMGQIVSDTNFEAIPWLVWMAESADPIVRRRAIALLGSMSDPEAWRKLRMLKTREPDSAIADQISQVLLATGTAAISVR